MRQSLSLEQVALVLWLCAPLAVVIHAQRPMSSTMNSSSTIVNQHNKVFATSSSSSDEDSDRGRGGYVGDKNENGGDVTFRGVGDIGDIERTRVDGGTFESGGGASGTDDGNYRGMQKNNRNGNRKNGISSSNNGIRNMDQLLELPNKQHGGNDASSRASGIRGMSALKKTLQQQQQNGTDNRPFGGFSASNRYNKDKNSTIFGVQYHTRHSARDPKPQPQVDPNDNDDSRDTSSSTGVSVHSSKSNSFNTLKEMTKQSTPAPPYHTLLDDDKADEQFGTKCSFEKPCPWTWEQKLNAIDMFRVVTGRELMLHNETGPYADTLGNQTGHFLHVLLNRNSTQKVIRSPVFSSTRENCFLEVMLHQSNMLFGKLRVVIEPVAAKETSWISTDILGNDLNKWKLYHFDIDRVSKDFQILFEIVPNITQNRALAHVSIDNLRMRNCFADSPRMDKCSVTQLQCKENKVPVCIEMARICDITMDCDENEDELFNCGEFLVHARAKFQGQGLNKKVFF